MGRGMVGAPWSADRSHGRTTPLHGHDSSATAQSARSVESLAGASRLPCGPDRLHRQVTSRKRLDVLDHSSGTIGRVQPQPARTERGGSCGDALERAESYVVSGCRACEEIGSGGSSAFAMLRRTAVALAEAGQPRCRDSLKAVPYVDVPI